MRPDWGSPDSWPVIPQMGVGGSREGESQRWDWDLPCGRGREVAMKLLKRLAIAAGSLLALMLAGGAHLKL